MLSLRWLLLFCSKEGGTGGEGVGDVDAVVVTGEKGGDAGDELMVGMKWAGGDACESGGLEPDGEAQTGEEHGMSTRWADGDACG